MNGTQFSSLIRNYTRTNSTTLPDTEIVLLANVVKDDFAKEIIKANEDIFGVLSYGDLVASTSGDPGSREYGLPSDTLQIKRVEACLDGNYSNYIELYELDLNQYHRTTQEAEILATFANERGKAFYDIFRKALWIYSGTIVATVEGLKLWSISYPADITTTNLSESVDLSIDPTTTTSGIPRQFHELWARKISMLWKSNKDKPIPLTEREQMFDKDWKSAMASITNANLDRIISAEVPDDTALQN